MNIRNDSHLDNLLQFVESTVKEPFKFYQNHNASDDDDDQDDLISLTGVNAYYQPLKNTMGKLYWYLSMQANTIVFFKLFHGLF